MSEAPKRRWFRWSLRTMFAALTVVCVLLGYNLNWIRQRDALRNSPNIVRSTLFNDAPGFLWVFREHGESWLTIRDGTDDELAIVQKNFPEAVVTIAGQRPTDEQIHAYNRMWNRATPNDPVPVAPPFPP